MAVTVQASRAGSPAVSHKAAARVGGARVVSGRKAFAGKAIRVVERVAAPSRQSAVCVQAVRNGEKLDRKLRVAVIGGGPSGAVAADDLVKGGVETFMFERKMDNCKVRTALKASVVRSVSRGGLLFPVQCLSQIASGCAATKQPYWQPLALGLALMQLQSR